MRLGGVKIFNFFKKKPNNKPFFKVLDESTWNLASDNVFEWEGVKIKLHLDEDRYASEKEIVDFIGAFIRACENNSNASVKQKEIGRTNLIAHIFNYLICGMDWGEVIQEATHWVNNYNPNGSKLKFDISDISTWEFASEQYIIWNNKLVYDKDEIPITEKEAVNLFNSIYAFLERNGEKLTSDYKVEKAKGMLNKLTNPIESNKEKEIIEPRNEVFDPRNPETYQYATNNQLILDGVSIFNTYQDETGKDVKKAKTEKEFVSILSLLLEIQKKRIVWEEAVNLVKPDFTFEGKEPTQETPDYIDRVNEVYQSILKNPATRLTKKQEKENIDDYIQRKIEECSPMPPTAKYLGGYAFTQAQIEVLGSLPDEDLVAIGKTMSSGLRGNKLKQVLFNAHGNLNRDWYYLAELCDLNVAWEKKIMSEYFSCYEFDTEEEIYNVLNSSEYLTTHPSMKEELIKRALEDL